MISEKEKKEIKKMVEDARFLAENDPQAFRLAQNGIDILKARCDLNEYDDTSKKTG